MADVRDVITNYSPILFCQNHKSKKSIRLVYLWRPIKPSEITEYTAGKLNYLLSQCTDREAISLSHNYQFSQVHCPQNNSRSTSSTICVTGNVSQAEDKMLYKW